MFLFSQIPFLKVFESLLCFLRLWRFVFSVSGELKTELESKACQCECKVKYAQTQPQKNFRAPKHPYLEQFKSHFQVLLNPDSECSV